ncbi:MAG: NblA/ycf18 family protein [Cyanobacteria bacterium P01_F01_bin.42]
MNISDNLTLEQQFKIRAFADQVHNLSKEEMQDLVVDLYSTSLLQQNAFKKMMGEYLGLSQATASEDPYYQHL